MPRTAGLAALVVLLVLPAASARAQEPPPPTDPAALPPLIPKQTAPPAGQADTERRLRELEKSNAELRAQVDKLREDHDYVEQRVDKLMPLLGRFGGYLDFGFFYVQGTGAGIRNDIANQHFPQYTGLVPDSWVFYGDPLSTAINSRGDPAETGESRAVTFDSVDNGGKSSFIVNALNFGAFVGIGDDLSLNGSVDFVPRGRDVSNPDGLFLGDFIDVKLAYVEYIVPIESFKLSLFAGKFDSVLGIEYRSQEAPDRLGITPSLICRYTCGRPLGLKARGQFFDEVLALNVAVTNGSHSTEGFPFHDEEDSNQFKTVASRLSAKAPIGNGLEVGASGSFGAQDLQPDESVYHWHFGFDLQLDWHDILLSAEVVKGEARGDDRDTKPACAKAPCLRYKGAYGQLGYRLFNWLTPYARVDWRNALHQSGASFVYITDILRFTGGLHFELGTNVVIKAEYTLNRELDPLPSFPDDVFTSSLVVKY